MTVSTTKDLMIIIF